MPDVPSPPQSPTHVDAAILAVREAIVAWREAGSPDLSATAGQEDLGPVQMQVGDVSRAWRQVMNLAVHGRKVGIALQAATNSIATAGYGPQRSMVLPVDRMAHTLLGLSISKQSGKQADVLVHFVSDMLEQEAEIRSSEASN